MPHRNVGQFILLSCAALSATGSAVFWALYFSMYWQHRDRFNELGRYIDESDVVVYQEQNGILIVPACGLAILATALFFVWWVRRRSAAAAPGTAMRVERHVRSAVHDG